MLDMRYNLFGLLILAGDIWAIVNILQSGATTGAKVGWTLLVVVLPVLGLIIWLIAGPKSNSVKL
jgi:Phospholipase_D-nuclease N-terminal